MLRTQLHARGAYPALIMNRICNSTTCDNRAEFTLTYDYAGQAAAIGPLAPDGASGGYDLCGLHAQRFTVPAGWTLIRHVESSGDF